MTLTGHIENGTVIFDTPPPLANGTVVDVSVREAVELPLSEEKIPTLFERFQSVIGKAVDLPEDFAMNHDHYRHGTPKR